MGCREPVMAISPQQGGTGPRRGVRRRHRAEGQLQHRSQGGHKPADGKGTPPIRKRKRDNSGEQKKRAREGAEEGKPPPPRPAPDISKKMRPKNGDKEG